MPLKLKDANKGQGPIAPAGNHPARCYQIVDMGTHTTETQFGVKTQRKIRFSWELPDEMHVFDEAKGPQPFSVSRTMNFSSHPKSNFLKMLESWRGKAFTKEELGEFEIRKVLGAPCMITVVHVTSDKNQNTYANVETVAPLPKQWKEIMVKAINDPVYYEISFGRNDVYKKLPDWMQVEIDKCNEWKDEGDEEPPFDFQEGPNETPDDPY